MLHYPSIFVSFACFLLTVFPFVFVDLFRVVPLAVGVASGALCVVCVCGWEREREALSVI